ncbi:hypothetical protein FQY83_06280 [Luteimonas marina]|uniref:Uncharacterized protein n=1 Tax=Luteimonas marina TaxID=488485 RepID=A0A5C5U9U5_9GAMM|nr:hypothetical protein [Luteimonas marina]TWT22618.1 hypothetical protein FQY83_06280 [Luteimonas marina]
MPVIRLPAASALALALSVATLSAPAQASQTELYIDVATHAMPGMPGTGAIGRLAGAIGGQRPSYGMARHPGMPGKYADIALYNRTAPGRPVSQAVPKGLQLGNSIDLLPRERRESPVGGGNDGTDGLGLADGGTYRIRYYWGCGEQARSGQPVEYSMTVRNGKVVQGGRAMAPRKVPDQGPDITPQHVLWPNPAARRAIPDKASLVGTHQVSGDGLPGSMQFALGDGDDFLPALELEGSGNPREGMTLEWNAVDGARAYFIHAMATHGDTVVMWSSSEDGYAGPELMNYLPGNLVAQWTGKRTLLGADARSCRIPREVFAGTEGAPMVQMIAYGNERSMAQPRPADAARDWAPAWNVRVRSKSTAMLMPGLGAGAAREAAKPAAKETAKGMLRGLLGR